MRTHFLAIAAFAVLTFAQHPVGQISDGQIQASIPPAPSTGTTAAVASTSRLSTTAISVAAPVFSSALTNDSSTYTTSASPVTSVPAPSARSSSSVQSSHNSISISAATSNSVGAVAVAVSSASPSPIAPSSTTFAVIVSRPANGTYIVSTSQTVPNSSKSVATSSVAPSTAASSPVIPAVSASVAPIISSPTVTTSARPTNAAGTFGVQTGVTLAVLVLALLA
ncbi:hypothetical protein BAUCODRAFT_240519 [Baudoinia panamericana UAMH 10762]|uniref:REJ domain-containing protein n=1 Tax=Baudoinia panamericana (strain UAMH 10762) TaxID=717646 RepID=M2N416_BAUPA|nr:uncharacterized protein BAUCODRAFT_240519 [Baudoinia panamericana UAMH 10762]EMC93445.1 hypothetical protein BAUCODRAFT_240519 [Baudoinia panamericana UAMH 10762]